jgi:hypothetical protein
MSYPNVECSHHSPAAPGYAVCLHVLQGVEVAFFEPATTENLGTITCAACHARRHDRVYTEENLSLTCVHCAREYGLLPKELAQ